MRQDEADSGRISALTTTEREELRFLRRENRVLKEEREIPKKVRHASFGTTKDENGARRTAVP
jgi:transposase